MELGTGHLSPKAKGSKEHVMVNSNKGETGCYSPSLEGNFEYHLGAKRMLRDMILCLTLVLATVHGVSAVNPGGMASGVFEFPAQGYNDMDFFFSIGADPHVTTIGVFWAQQFGFQNARNGGYLGLQTNGSLHGSAIGKMAIYSIWDVHRGEPGPGAAVETFGGEGTGISLRLPFLWQQGHRYRFHLANQGSSWWGLTIRDLGTGSEAYMGRIQVGANFGKLQGQSVNFTEVYFGAASCPAVPYARVRFDPPQANSGTVNSRLVSKETYGDCVSYARTFTARAALFQEIGIDRSHVIPKEEWRLKFVDSEETAGENGKATNAFDRNSKTYWHSRWSDGTSRLPHEIQIDLGVPHVISAFKYLPRQDGSLNGRVKGFQFYVSLDGLNWGQPAASGNFANDALEKTVGFPPKTGRYIKLRALSEVNGQPWTSSAEIGIIGITPH